MQRRSACARRHASRRMQWSRWSAGGTRRRARVLGGSPAGGGAKPEPEELAAEIPRWGWARCEVDGSVSMPWRESGSPAEAEATGKDHCEGRPFYVTATLEEVGRRYTLVDPSGWQSEWYATTGQCQEEHLWMQGWYRETLAGGQAAQG